MNPRFERLEEINKKWTVFKTKRSQSKLFNEENEEYLTVSQREDLLDELISLIFI